MEVRICVGDRVCVGEVGEAELVALVDLVRGVRDRCWGSNSRGELAGLTPRAIRGAGEKSGGVGTARELGSVRVVDAADAEFDTRVCV